MSEIKKIKAIGSSTLFVERVVRYIRQLEAREVAKLTVAELAGQLDVNRSVLYRNFVKELGMTPGTFLVEARKKSVLSGDERKSIANQVSSYIDALPPEQMSNLTVGLVARKFNVCPSYLARSFKKEKGASIDRYISMAKLMRNVDPQGLSFEMNAMNTPLDRARF